MAKKGRKRLSDPGEKRMPLKFDYQDILRLIDILEERNLSHFELEIEGLKIKIGRNLPPSRSQTLPAAENPPLPSEVEDIPPPEGTIAGKNNNLYIISSPMVGTFYRSPDPNSQPFVEIGDTVKKKQILCIIEAMKLMNEIESDIEGTLKEIFVENGSPIEYGQKLFAIQPLS